MFFYYTLGGRNENKFCSFPNRNHFLHVDFNDVSLPGADTMKATCLLKRELKGASLVAQWLRVCLPMQGTRVRALVWEDPICRGATGPVRHNY